MLYFFRRPVKANIDLAFKSKFPRDFFYGFTEINKHFKVEVSDDGENSRLIRFIHNLFNLILSKFSLFSTSLIPLIPQFKKIQKANILFATVDSYGLALSIMKTVGFFKKQKIIYNTIGICDNLVESPNIAPLYTKLLSQVNLFISGASKTECLKMAKMLKFPVEKFKFIPFGIDTDYFKQTENINDGYILIIGADKKRDWDLYKKLFFWFPKISFIVITHPNLISFKIPNNVSVVYNQTIDKVKQYIARSSFLVILSKQNYHFAGQSTAFRGMSMAKPVIFTNSYGVFEYNFKNGYECFLVDPNNRDQLKKYVSKLLRDKMLRLRMGVLARDKIVKELSIKHYAKKLIKSFKRV